MISYAYVISGTGGHGSTWSTEGHVVVKDVDQFDEAVMDARRQSFMQLTQGKATYGKPGQGGCKGPYRITKFSIEEV